MILLCVMDYLFSIVFTKAKIISEWNPIARIMFEWDTLASFTILIALLYVLVWLIEKVDWSKYIVYGIILFECITVGKHLYILDCL